MLLRPIGDGTLAYSASLGGVLRLLVAFAWDLGLGIVVKRTFSKVVTTKG